MHGAPYRNKAVFVMNDAAVPLQEWKGNNRMRNSKFCKSRYNM